MSVKNLFAGVVCCSFAVIVTMQSSHTGGAFPLIATLTLFVRSGSAYEQQSFCITKSLSTGPAPPVAIPSYAEGGMTQDVLRAPTHQLPQRELQGLVHAEQEQPTHPCVNQMPTFTGLT